MRPSCPGQYELYMPSMYSPLHATRGPEKYIHNLVTEFGMRQDIGLIMVDCGEKEHEAADIPVPFGRKALAYGYDPGIRTEGKPSPLPTKNIRKWSERAMARRYKENLTPERTENISLSHAVTMYPRVLMAARHLHARADVPFLVSPRGSDIPHHNGDYTYADTDWWLGMLKNAAFITPNSTQLRNELVDAGVKPHNIVVIPNGVDGELFTPLQPDRKPAAAIEAVYSGRLVPFKRVHCVVLAVRQAIAEGIDVRLDIHGYGAEGPAIQALIAEHGLQDRITCAGTPYEPAQLPQLVRNANVYITASETEGTPNATLEAMSLGLAVMTSDEAGGYDLFPREYPLRIDGKSPADSILGKLRLLHQDPDMIGEQQAECSRLAASFTWAKTADAYIALYHEMLRAPLVRADGK